MFYWAKAVWWRVSVEQYLRVLVLRVLDSVKGVVGGD